MKILVKILVRVLLIVILIIAFNNIYKKYFLEEDVKNQADILGKLYDKISLNPEVLYFGESSNFTWSPKDKEKKTISEFMTEYYPTLNIQTVDKGALHAKLYSTLLENIPDSSTVKTIIVTMNYRSFNSDWINSKIETSLMKMNEFMNPDLLPIINRFILSLNTFNNLTHEERKDIRLNDWKKSSLNEPEPYNSVYTWNKEIYNKGILDSKGNYDSLKTQLAGHYVKSYAFLIDTLTNPRIHDFDRIVKYAKKRGWNLVFNIVAENLQKADELIGERLLNIFRKNKALLINRYNKDGVIVVDNLGIVEDEQFIDQDWTSEHYYEKGRKKVARNIALNLRKIYPANFVDNRSNLHFFNDMEGSVEWANNSSIVAEKSFSGSKSCKIFKEQKYSVSFVKELSEVGLSLPDKVEISFMFLNPFHNVVPELVVELSNGDKNNWKSYPIQSKQEWTKANIIYDIPKEFKNGRIKIYVWNRAEEPIYIDDIDINFSYNSMPRENYNDALVVQNDFETDSINWGNLSTLTKGKAYSGTVSSKVNHLNQYSPTFIEKVITIKDFSYVNINVKAFQERKNKVAELVFQIGDDKVIFLRNSIKLFDENSTINQWNNIMLKSNLKQFDFPNTLLKVYVWNPDTIPVYIDDFKIEFVK